MITAFISHSSQQKRFVEQLVSILSKTNCLVDEYDFEPAKKSKDEIFSKIRKADIFILLISQAALESEWVAIEIEKARDRMKKQKLKFFPYIIDYTVNFNDKNIPVWINKEEVFNLKTFTNVVLLSRDILQKQREIIYQQRPELKLREELFVGRNTEIEELEAKLYTGNYADVKAIVVSGRPGVGRRKFIKKYVQSKLANYSDEPYRIDLTSKDYIENFIMQLNSYMMLYNLTDFEWDIWDKDKKVSVAVELINEAYKTKQHILIVDDGACITPKGGVSEWLADILTYPTLTRFLGLFIASSRTPKTHRITNRKECIFLELHPLSDDDLTKLFYAYIAQRGIPDFDKEEVEFWVSKLHGSPEQLFYAAEAVNREGRTLAKSNVDRIVAFGDKSLKDIIEYCTNTQIGKLKLIDLMGLLTHLGPINDRILFRIVGDDLKETCDKMLEELFNLSIIEVFGPSKEMIKLDAGIADYIDRSGYKILDRFSKSIDKISKEILAEPFDPRDGINDLSDYMYRIHVKINAGQCDAKLFIPSVAIKSIIDLYKSEKYDSVINLCEGFLKHKDRIYNDARREIIYWMCLSLARKLNRPKFNIAVEEITGISKTFLQGFFLRLSGDLPAAERKFRDILDKYPDSAKTLRELVTVLLMKRDYPQALNMAKKNHEANPINPYHIEAYFRCLVRKNSLTYDDRKKLEDLIRAMESSYDIHKDKIVKTMKAEYQIYVGREVQTPLKILIELNKQPHVLNYTRQALNELQERQGMPTT